MSQLVTTSYPHLRFNDSVERRMRIWNLALLPVALGVLGTFGASAFSRILFSVAGAALGQIAGRFMLRTSRHFWPDARSVYLGTLIALLLEPMVPLWIIAAAAFFSVLIAEELYGGYGASLFHPALIGWMFAQFLLRLSGTDAPTNPLWTLVDGKIDLGFRLSSFFWGARAGTLGEASLMMLLCGGGILIWKRLVPVGMPFFFLSAIYLIGLASGFDPEAELLVGPVFLLAFFIVSDPAVTPSVRWGKSVYALLLGAVFVISRHLFSRPEAAIYSLVVLNGLSPFFDFASMYLFRKGDK